MIASRSSPTRSTCRPSRRARSSTTSRRAARSSAPRAYPAGVLRRARSALRLPAGRTRVVVLDDPAAIVAALREELARADAGRRGQASDAAVLRPRTFFETRRRSPRGSRAHAWSSLHRAAIGGAAKATASRRYEVRLANGAHAGRARPRGPRARGEGGARHEGASAADDPRAARRGASRTGSDHGLRVVLTARAETQAERLVALLRHQDVALPRAPRRLRSGVARDDERAGARARSTRRSSSARSSRGVLLPGRAASRSSPRRRSSARARTAREKQVATRQPRAVPRGPARALASATTSCTSSTASAATRGSCTRTSAASTVDLLVVEYAGGDKLYLPVYRLNQIQKYSGGEGAAPKLDRLGGQTFAKTKARVEKAVRQMADELLRLYAERQAQPARRAPAGGRRVPRLRGDVPVRRDARSGAAPSTTCTRDLETPRPMDRLVCGDVGFGKTEVAIRAAFRVAMAGKQVAVLCPTTVLAQQHFRTFEARLRDYPITLARALALPDRRRSRRDARAAQGGQGRHRHRHAPPALEGRPLQGPRPARRRRGAALRRHAQGAHQAAPHAGRRAHAHGDAHPAHAADGGERACATCRSSRRRRVDRRAVRTIVTRYDDHGRARGRRARARRAAARSSTSTTASRASTSARSALQQLVPAGAHRRGARADGRREGGEAARSSRR